MERIGFFANDVAWIDDDGHERRGSLLGVSRIAGHWVALVLRGGDGRAVEVDDVFACEFGVCFASDADRIARAERWLAAHPGRTVAWLDGIAPHRPARDDAP